MIKLSNNLATLSRNTPPMLLDASVSLIRTLKKEMVEHHTKAKLKVPKSLTSKWTV